MSPVKVSDEGTLSLTQKGIAIFSGLFMLGITVATVTATMITRDSQYATQDQVRSLSRVDSVLISEIREVKSDHLGYSSAILGMQKSIDQNGTLTQIVINRQNLTLCKLFGANSSVCANAINTRPQ